MFFDAKFYIANERIAGIIKEFHTYLSIYVTTTEKVEHGNMIESYEIYVVDFNRRDNFGEFRYELQRLIQFIKDKLSIIFIDVIFPTCKTIERIS